MKQGIQTGRVFKCAVVQSNPRIGDKAYNLARILETMEIAAANGSKLIAFTEAELTGYCFNDLHEAKIYSEEVPGRSTGKIINQAREHDLYVVVGLLENFQGKLFNSTVLIGPEGIIGKYRKTHRIYLGADRFSEKGDIPYTVYSTPIGNIGLIICYDLLFPEACRALALQGADIIINSTNLPLGTENFIETLLPARALENRVFMIASSRVGMERGMSFIGASSIVDPYGRFLARAGSDQEEIIYADLKVGKARSKQTIIKPGEYEFDIFKDRRTEFYGEICLKRENE
ncbi:Aliphatic amidase amiE [Desulfosporosinus sp. I2]|uniref:carbon-nitrogen hydrolase family protein n=1 Tax=Desulfosporosinus sp. I2 TaxID=1617025 RepID=UPI0005EF8F80|nr:carbon-nitrogen hydrolase family protein [Desulfosporosinus sp. I2]KJR45003.1 Aliphatic amidase amiE [Desulfosporosinus sp. I2]